MDSLRIGIFCDKFVGKRTVEFILSKFKDHLKCVCLVDENSEILPMLQGNIDNEFVFFSNNLYTDEVISRLKKLDLDYIILAWWPKIIKEPILSISKRGLINFHNSFLPHGRGKNPNFWSIVEETPYGVSIHFVSPKIDEGDILFQKEIEVGWEDTGGTLYKKSLKAIVELFAENYPKLLTEQVKPIKQELDKGSFHLSKELSEKSQIILDNSYSARDLINLLRARTFNPHPGCYFYDNNNKYEVRIEISKVQEECST